MRGRHRLQLKAWGGGILLIYGAGSAGLTTAARAKGWPVPCTVCVYGGGRGCGGYSQSCVFLLSLASALGK